MHLFSFKTPFKMSKHLAFSHVFRNIDNKTALHEFKEDTIDPSLVAADHDLSAVPKTLHHGLVPNSKVG